MQDLKVTLVQTELSWEDTKANLAHFSGLLDNVDDTDLIVLPEMFSTGFSMNAKGLAEPMSGLTLAWLKEQSAAKGAVITGSVIIEEEGHFFNRLIWMRPDGSFATYDKRHLFTMANEQDHYTAGKERLLVELKGWKICPQICYDLRFPVWNRNTDGYDCLIMVANWPERRSYFWKQLLVARAIENQSYVAGVNRVGNDGNDVYHSGDSSLVDPLGEVVFTQADRPFVKTFSLSAERLVWVREKFPFLQDADDFKIE